MHAKLAVLLGHGAEAAEAARAALRVLYVTHPDSKTLLDQVRTNEQEASHLLGNADRQGPAEEQ